MLCHLLLGVIVVTVVSAASTQIDRIQLGSEAQAIDLPSSTEPRYGQRLFPSRNQRRRFFSTSTRVPLTSRRSTPSLSPSTTEIVSTYRTVSLDESEEIQEPLQQRSLLTGDVIVVNKSQGVCAFDGRVYQSGENIERSHLCHFCFCRNGYIDCYWKNCPPAPEGCVELNYEGVCERSLYLCPIPSKRNKPASARKSVRSLRIKRQLAKKGNFSTALGCEILGVTYRVGELVGVATDPCLECRCAIEALYCSPKCCFQPVEPDEVTQQLQRSIGHQPVLSNPLQHLRSEFSREFDSE